MPSGARPAALAAALLACLAIALPASAAQRPPRLVAQIAQAAPTATPGGEPQLSDEPPTQLGSKKNKGGTAKTGATGAGNGGQKSSSGSLAQTGSDAGMLGLAGFALLGWGVALRLRLRDAA